MTVKIMIKRRVPAEKREKFLALTNKLRSEAITQSGYITGEALQSLDKSDEFLVISTWSGPDEWNAWKVSPMRVAIQNEIDKFLGTATDYEVFRYLAD